MITLKELYSQYSEDIDAVISWCDEIYQAKFASYFSKQRDLYHRLHSKQHPITDSELEQILTEIPLDLFSVSEVLSQFRISQEVVKLRTTQKKADIVNSSIESTLTKRQEVASLSILEDKLLQTAYSTVIERVEHEMTFSRELIMGAKKIWDSRRQAEESNPVGEVVPGSDLPEYNRNTAGKTYIR